MIAVCLIVMLFFLFLGVPVFASILSAVAVYFATHSSPSVIIAQRMISSIESVPLLAIPFFVCSGILMNYSGITVRIMNFCKVITRKMHGGLGQVNVLLSTLMGGMSGSNLADATMEAKILVPEMEKAGFSKPFSTAVTAFSSIITPLIPPSIGMIIYASLANISIGKLFAAGFSPGLLLCFAMMILVSAISKKRGYQPPAKDKLRKGELHEAFKQAWAPLCTPIIIIGTIRLGIATPTEAGAICIVYAILLGIIYKEMSFKRFFIAMKETVITTATILFIVSAASSLGWVLTKEGIPQKLANAVIGVGTSKFMFFLIVNLLLLFLGCFMEGNSIMLILVPLLVPIARSLGINDIHFAIVFLFNLGMGCLTPPVGTVMFATCNVTKCKTTDFVKEAIPFYLMFVICLTILTVFETASLFFVNLIY